MGPGLQGETEAGVGVTKGDTRKNPWKGSLNKYVEPERNFMGLYALSFS